MSVRLQESPVAANGNLGIVRVCWMQQGEFWALSYAIGMHRAQNFRLAGAKYLRRGAGCDDRALLQPACEQQDDDDNRDKAEATAGPIAPSVAVGPGRHGTDQHQDKNNQQYGA